MKKHSTSERLKEIMSIKNLKQIDIIRLAEPHCNKYNIKLGKNDLSQYISGKVEPGQNKLYILSLALNVNEAWLMGYDVPMEKGISNFNVTNKQKKIISDFEQLDTYGKNVVQAVIDAEKIRCKEQQIQWQKENIIQIRFSELSVSAGTGIFLDDESYKTISVIKSNISLRADFAVKVSGDSMEPDYYDGDIVLVECNNNIRNGEIGVFIADNEGYIKEKGENCLISHNKKYSDIPMEHFTYIKYIGKVIGKAEIFKLSKT